MSSTAELKKVKLNVNNIRSVLLDGKKAVDEKKKDREDFLQKLAEEKKQKQEEKGLEEAIKPTQKKPDLKSPVKSSMGLMDRVFNFVGAIVGGIIVKALPEIIDAVKKIMKEVKPIFEKIVEGLKPVFKFIGDLFKDKGTYDSEKEKVDEDIDKAKLAGKDIDGQVGELNKASDDIINENKGLAANSKALEGEEKGLMEDPEETMDDDSDELYNEDSNEIESNEVATSDGLTNNAEVTTTVDGKEVVVTGANDSLKLQNEAKDLLKSNETENTLDKVNNAEFAGVKVLTAPVSPVREDYPKTKAGLKAYINAKKEYIIKYKEFKKTQQNLIKPTDKNKNGLTALNTTDGLTSNNISSSKTIVLQRQIARVNTPVQV